MREPHHLHKKLKFREKENALRKLKLQTFKHDFFSNDYLGFVRSGVIEQRIAQMENKSFLSGSTGSRLLSGNYSLITESERFVANYHNAESALLFNSGYTANVGFFSCVPQRGEVVLYDALIHASIRDGLLLGMAHAYKFRHNDTKHLEVLLKKHSKKEHTIYVVTESVFSMDGDSPKLKDMAELCEQYNAHLIVDEAHAVGIFGEKGKGLVSELKLERKIFARIITYGKAFGCHGAAIVGSKNLTHFLINFARSFIYTTAMPEHSVACIMEAYNELVVTENIAKIHQIIKFFREEMTIRGLHNRFVCSESAIQAFIIPGNDKAKSVAKKLQNQGFGVMPILSPTVSKGQERLRFCLHSFNSYESIELLFDHLQLLISD